MTCGPWRPITLEVFESRIADLYFTTDVHESLKSAEMVAMADVEGSATAVKFDVTLAGVLISSETAKVEDGLARSTFKFDEPSLWYPVRYGKQPLYSLTATLLHSHTEIASQSKRFGLRRAELVQRPMTDQPGTTFFFQVNNIPIFCGGSDWIPADNFIPRISREKYYDWVKLVADGNQFMIRVWGGGIYEEQAFYDACDELGVLVWQDFMFGCGNYPAHPEMLASIKREAEENLKLLRHHTSIIIWAGNNEDYQYQEQESLTYDPSNKDSESWLKTNFPARYIYEKVLADACTKLIPDTYYHFGSPWGGKDTTDPTIGDIHQWNVWHGSQEKYQNFDKLIGRFVSEFGMEAFPSMKTIDAFLPLGKDDPDRYPQSSTVDFHNKADGHERRIALYLVENMRYSPDPFEQFVYCTQLMQAECLSSAYRLWKRQWKGPGREYCGGALVWQINDCWPVTSWAIVDYYLRPKMAYFAVKREMALLSIGMTRRVTETPRSKYSRIISKEHTIELWGSNLGLEDLTVDVMIKAFDVATGTLIHEETMHKSFELLANRSTEIAAFPVPVRSSGDGSCGAESVVVAAYLLDVKTGAQRARYVNWPEPLKYAPLQRPRELVVRLGDSGDVVEISAEVPLKGVVVEWEESEEEAAAGRGVVLEDNGVDVVPGEVVKIGVRGAKRDLVFEGRYLGMV